MLKLPYKENFVEDIYQPANDLFNKLIQNGEPFKIKGVMDDWPLLKELSNINNPIDQCDYLSSLVVNRTVRYSVLPPEQKGSFRLNEKLEQNFSFDSRVESFSGFIHLVKQHINGSKQGTLYLQAAIITELMNRIKNIEQFRGFTPSSQPLFWIGTGNQFVGLHNDPFRNMLAVLCGVKRVILFPPEELPNIYPAPFDKRSGNALSSLVDVLQPNLKKFPLFNQSLQRLKIATITPGELLYIPPLWWHAVESIGFNVGINCWFFDDGKINKLQNLNIPGESLLVSINKKNISYSKKKKLYKKFKKTIEMDMSILKSRSYMDFKTIKTAKKIRVLINQAKLGDAQKNIWENWVKIFAKRYIFCLDGKPFPTLPNNEFQEMIKRYELIRRERILKIIKQKFSLTFFSHKYRGKHQTKERHGIVPS